MTYCPGQVREIFPYIREDVKYFLLGGPADGDEAQVFAKRFPSAKIFGFEPNPWGVEAQRDFPGILLPVALWDDDVPVQLRIVRELDVEDRARAACVGVQTNLPASNIEVEGRSLDSLSDEFGPFENLVLWIDIEGSENAALMGARGLLKNRAITLINLEAHVDGDVSETSKHRCAFHDLLEPYGFEEVKRWNGQRYSNGIRWDLVFKLR